MDSNVCFDGYVKTRFMFKQDEYEFLYNRVLA